MALLIFFLAAALLVRIPGSSSVCTRESPCDIVLGGLFEYSHIAQMAADLGVETNLGIHAAAADNPIRAFVMAVADLNAGCANLTAMAASLATEREGSWVKDGLPPWDPTRYRFKLSIGETCADELDGVQALHTMLETDTLAAVVGAKNTPVTKAITQLAAVSETMVVSYASTGTTLDEYPNFLRVVVDDSVQALAIARLVQRLNVGCVGVLRCTGLYAFNLAQDIIAALKSLQTFQYDKTGEDANVKTSGHYKLLPITIFDFVVAECGGRAGNIACDAPEVLQQIDQRLKDFVRSGQCIDNTIVRNKTRETHPSTIILSMNYEQAEVVLQRASKMNLTGNITFVGTDAWIGQTFTALERDDDTMDDLLGDFSIGTMPNTPLSEHDCRVGATECLQYFDRLGWIREEASRLATGRGKEAGARALASCTSADGYNQLLHKAVLSNFSSNYSIFTERSLAGMAKCLGNIRNFASFAKHGISMQDGIARHDALVRDWQRGATSSWWGSKAGSLSKDTMTIQDVWRYVMRNVTKNGDAVASLDTLIYDAVIATVAALYTTRCIDQGNPGQCFFHTMVAHQRKHALVEGQAHGDDGCPTHYTYCRRPPSMTVNGTERISLSVRGVTGKIEWIPGPMWTNVAPGPSDSYSVPYHTFRVSRQHAPFENSPSEDSLGHELLPVAMDTDSHTTSPYEAEQMFLAVVQRRTVRTEAGGPRVSRAFRKAEVVDCQNVPLSVRTCDEYYRAIRGDPEALALFSHNGSLAPRAQLTTACCGYYPGPGALRSRYSLGVMGRWARNALSRIDFRWTGNCGRLEEENEHRSSTAAQLRAGCYLPADDLATSSVSLGSDAQGKEHYGEARFEHFLEYPQSKAGEAFEAVEAVDVDRMSCIFDAIKRACKGAPEHQCEHGSIPFNKSSNACDFQCFTGRPNDKECNERLKIQWFNPGCYVPPQTEDRAATVIIIIGSVLAAIIFLVAPAVFYYRKQARTRVLVRVGWVRTHRLPRKCRLYACRRCRVVRRWTIRFPRHARFHESGIHTGDGDDDEMRAQAILGTGAFGEVLRGTLVVGQGQLRIAIKQVLPTKASLDDRRAVLVECRLQLALHQCPFVVKCYGFCVPRGSGSFLILLELMDCGDLPGYVENVVRGGGRVPEATRLQWMIEAASALEYMHASGLLHGDVAARNLCLAKQDGRIVCKLADFGMSRAVDEGGKFLQRVGQAVPIWWTAPECLPAEPNFTVFGGSRTKTRGSGDGNAVGRHVTRSGSKGRKEEWALPRTLSNDVWALGMVMWELEMMAGTGGRLVRPFPDETMDTIYDALMIKRRRLTFPNGSLVALAQTATESCWRLRPWMRANASNVRKSLQASLLAHPQTWDEADVAAWLRRLGARDVDPEHAVRCLSEVLSKTAYGSARRRDEYGAAADVSKWGRREVKAWLRTTHVAATLPALVRDVLREGVTGGMALFALTEMGLAKMLGLARHRKDHVRALALEFDIPPDAPILELDDFDDLNDVVNDIVNDEEDEAAPAPAPAKGGGAGDVGSTRAAQAAAEWGISHAHAVYLHNKCLGIARVAEDAAADVFPALRNHIYVLRLRQKAHDADAAAEREPEVAAAAMSEAAVPEAKPAGVRADIFHKTESGGTKTVRSLAVHSEFPRTSSNRDIPNLFELSSWRGLMSDVVGSRSYTTSSSNPTSPRLEALSLVGLGLAGSRETRSSTYGRRRLTKHWSSAGPRNAAGTVVVDQGDGRRRGSTRTAGRGSVSIGGKGGSGAGTGGDGAPIPTIARSVIDRAEEEIGGFHSLMYFQYGKTWPTMDSEGHPMNFAWLKQADFNGGGIMEKRHTLMRARTCESSPSSANLSATALFYASIIPTPTASERRHAEALGGELKGPRCSTEVPRICTRPRGDTLDHQWQQGDQRRGGGGGEGSGRGGGEQGEQKREVELTTIVVGQPRAELGTGDADDIIIFGDEDDVEV